VASYSKCDDNHKASIGRAGNGEEATVADFMALTRIGLW